LAPLGAHRHRSVVPLFNIGRRLHGVGERPRLPGGADHRADPFDRRELAVPVLAAAPFAPLPAPLQRVRAERGAAGAGATAAVRPLGDAVQLAGAAPSGGAGAATTTTAPAARHAGHRLADVAAGRVHGQPLDLAGADRLAAREL